MQSDIVRAQQACSWRPDKCIAQQHTLLARQAVDSAWQPVFSGPKQLGSNPKGAQKPVLEMPNHHRDHLKKSCRICFLHSSTPPKVSVT